MTKDHDLGVPDEEDLRRRKETLENSELSEQRKQVLWLERYSMMKMENPMTFKY
ncbi:MAG: hypothetical protein J7L34_06395 [Thermotogaceae bacterium]|nr:hypothetical protein [Thermotogaceae bacterium]